MNPGSSHPNKASKYRGATFLNGEQQPLQKPFIENLFSFTEEDTVSKVQFLSKNEFWRNFANLLFWIFAPNIVHIFSWKFILDQKWRLGTVWGDERQACHFKRWIPFILSSSSSGRSCRWLAWWAKVTLFILIVFVRPLVGRRDTSSSPGLYY